MPGSTAPHLPTRFLAAAVLLGLAAAAQARPFPPEALRGELVVTAPPEVLLNQKPARLAPGARIRDGANRVVLSGSLAGQKLVVHYTRFADGQLRDVWLLTAAEVARQPWPRTPAEAAAWRFDPPSQTWIKP